MSLRSRTGLKQFETQLAEQERQQEEQRLAPIKAQARRNAELEQQIAETEKAIVQQEVFSQPSEHLKKVCAAYKKNLTVEQVTAAIGNAVSALKFYLDAQGKEITTSGLQKLGRISELNPDIDTTEPKNLIIIFDYLTENDCLNSSDVKVVRIIQPAQEEKAAEPKLSLADIQAQVENTESASREGQAKVRKLAMLAMCMEAQPVYHEFSAFIASTYGYTMTQEDGDRCVQYLRDNNLRLDSKAAWDKARVNVLGFLSPQERANREMNADDNLTAREFAKKHGITRSGATIGL
jgi:hypothetical protein